MNHPMCPVKESKVYEFGGQRNQQELGLAAWSQGRDVPRGGEEGKRTGPQAQLRPRQEMEEAEARRHGHHP